MPISPKNGAAGAAGAAGATGADAYAPNGGRITLQTGVAVPTTDQTAKTTLYWTPYKSGQISLYYSSTWTARVATEKSIAVPNVASTMHDVFAYWTGSAVALEVLAWTNDTTRATALTTQDGVMVKSGDATRRYLGSFRTTSSSGQTEDSAAKRFVWNFDNQVPRALRRACVTSSWTYSSSTIRQWRGNSAEQVEFVIGVADQHVLAVANMVGVNASGNWSTGVSLNSTTAFQGDFALGVINGNGLTTTASLLCVPAAGYSYIAGVEKGDGTWTTTFNGTAATFQSGISAKLLC